MHVDLAAELISALRSSSGRDALAAAIAPVIAAEMRRALDAREERLETLAEILGIANDTARKKLKRDHALRACGVVVGRQWKARRSAVLEHIESAPTRRALGAAR